MNHLLAEPLGESHEDSIATGLPDDKFRRICGMRDVLIHNYMGVDVQEVWNVASMRVPELRSALVRYLSVEAETDLE